jgi:hypothetical protein
MLLKVLTGHEKILVAMCTAAASPSKAACAVDANAHSHRCHTPNQGGRLENLRWLRESYTPYLAVPRVFSGSTVLLERLCVSTSFPLLRVAQNELNPYQEQAPRAAKGYPSQIRRISMV